MAEIDTEYYTDPNFLKSIEQVVDKRLSKEQKTECAQVDTYFEKYLDKRFEHIEEGFKEIRSDVKGWKLWVVGIGVSVFIGLAAIIISLLTYHANVMQTQLSGIQSQVSQYQSQLNAQMQTFTEYVKAVTNPPSRPPKENKTSNK
jgi:hypothetical protein